MTTIVGSQYILKWIHCFEERQNICINESPRKFDSIQMPILKSSLSEIQAYYTDDIDNTNATTCNSDSNNNNNTYNNNIKIMIIIMKKNNIIMNKKYIHLL